MINQPPHNSAKRKIVTHVPVASDLALLMHPVGRIHYVFTERQNVLKQTYWFYGNVLRLMLNAHLPTGSRQLAISPTAD